MRSTAEALIPLESNTGHGQETMLLSVSVPKDTDPAVVPSLTEAMTKAVAIVLGGGSDGTGTSSVLQRADRLAELVTGVFEPNVELVENRLHRMQTIRKILEEGQWLTAEQLNALQPDPPANKSHPASDWKRRGRIFSVSYRGKEYFARYQFDAQYQPLPIVKDTLRALGQVADPWTLAAWFHFPNAWIAKKGESGLESVAPKDALDRREALLNAAVQRETSYVA